MCTYEKSAEQQRTIPARDTKNYYHVYSSSGSAFS